MSTYTLPQAFQGYEAGTVLQDVTLAEARAMECNRCSDCCDGSREGVKKDEATGLPKFTWGSNAPEDLYAERYGERMLIPLVRGDGGVVEGDDFEVDADGKRYTAFRCRFLDEAPSDGCEGACKLYGLDKDPKDLTTIRPRNCGDFPVFALSVYGTVSEGNPFIPPTGALPRCTWHGLRIVGLR